MDESVSDFLRFWNMLKSADSVPKELVLELANAKDAITVGMLILLDKECAYLQGEKHRAKQQQQGLKNYGR